MSSRPPKVEFGRDYETDQIYSMGYEFAFMSRVGRGNSFKQATPFVYCKDFLHDAIWAFLNKTNVNIYSFKYEFGKNPDLVMNRTVLAFRNTEFKKKKKGEEFHAMMPACLEFLQLCDRQLGFRPTQIFEVSHNKGPCWLIVADPGWQHAPTMISLFTLFVRVGCFHTPGATLEETLALAEKGKISIGNGSGYAGNRDCSYIKQGRKGIDLILEHGLDVWHGNRADNYPKKLNANGELHDNFGIVNFTASRPREAMPHWYRKEIWGK
jgi:hypothetical protein